jgi:hypothetical protein
VLGFTGSRAGFGSQFQGKEYYGADEQDNDG